MPIVWQTMRNLVLRAAQAPFKFIGGLIAGGGSQDLGTVSFAPGTSELSTGAQADLDKLAAALKQVVASGGNVGQAQYPLLAQADQIHLEPKGALLLGGRGRDRPYHRQGLQATPAVALHLFHVADSKAAAAPTCER